MAPSIARSVLLAAAMLLALPATASQRMAIPVDLVLYFDQTAPPTVEVCVEVPRVERNRVCWTLRELRDLARAWRVVRK